MKKQILLSAVALVTLFSSCEDSETIAPAEITITGTFASTEVEIKSTETKTLPDFPYAEVVETEGYTMTASNENNPLGTSWQQSLSSNFDYSTSAEVTFNIQKAANYATLKETYSLTGTQIVPYGTESAIIKMYNTQYAAISVFSEFVENVTIESFNDAPFTTSSVDQASNIYFYSFVEPLKSYKVLITDIQGYIHTVDITADQLLANDNAILYLEQNDINGGFKIVYEWVTVPVIINPSPSL